MAAVLRLAREVRLLLRAVENRIGVRQLRKSLTMVAALALAVAMPCVGFSQSESGGSEAANLSQQVPDEPPMLGVSWVRGYQPRSTVQSSQTPTNDRVARPTPLDDASKECESVGD